MYRPRASKKRLYADTGAYGPNARCSTRRISCTGLMNRLRSTKGAAAITRCLSDLKGTNILYNLSGCDPGILRRHHSSPHFVTCSASLVATATGHPGSLLLRSDTLQNRLVRDTVNTCLLTQTPGETFQFGNKRANEAGSVSSMAVGLEQLPLE